MPGIGMGGSRGVPAGPPANASDKQPTGAGALGLLGQVPVLAWVALGLVALWWWNRKK